MKRLIFIFGVIGAGLCSPAAHAAAPTECFANSAAVFAAHPNASHASYSLRMKKSQRCWYADAFRAEAKAKAKPALLHPVAMIVRASTTHSASAVAPEPRTTAIAPTPQPRAMAIAAEPRPHVAAATPASRPSILQFPREIPPAIQISINAQELCRLSPDETPADFESRFSVSGYRGRK